MPSSNLRRRCSQLKASPIALCAQQHSSNLWQGRYDHPDSDTQLSWKTYGLLLLLLPCVHDAARLRTCKSAMRQW